MAEKKEGFSYISPQKQKKNAFISFIFEAIIVIIVVVGIFYALEYFNIFSLRKVFFQFNNSPFASQNEIKHKTKTGMTPKPLPLPVDHEISTEFISDIPTYKLTVSNQKAVDEILHNWRVGGYLTKQNKNTNVDTLSVHLTDIEQKYNQVTITGLGIVTSSNLEYTANKAILSIYISPKMFADPLAKNDQTFTNEFLSTLYILTHPAGSVKEMEEIQKQQNTQILKIKKENPDLFKIIKK